jgi:parallel beta-helix repeat protein
MYLIYIIGGSEIYKILPFMIVILINSFSNIMIAESSNNIIYVDDDGTADYLRIQNAIDNSSEGDTVYVYKGVYYENITINKSIKLIGENKYETIIDGKNIEVDGVSLVLITSDNVKLNNFTIKNSNWSNIFRFDNGISLYYSNNTSVCDTRIIKCRRGIEIFSSSAIIINNSIEGYGDTGIGVWNSDAIIFSNIVDGDYSSCIFSGLSNTSIEKNIVRNSSTYGIHISDSIYKRGTNIIGNHIQDNSFGIFMDYCYSINVDHNNFIDNRLNVLFSNCFYTKWNSNYWNRPRVLPKPILGFIWIYPSIPILNFDWHPSKELYEIF